MPNGDFSSARFTQLAEESETPWSLCKKANQKTKRRIQILQHCISHKFPKGGNILDFFLSVNCKQTVKMLIFHTVKHSDDWILHYKPTGGFYYESMEGGKKMKITLTCLTLFCRSVTKAS